MAQALTVLKQFYEGAAGATSLVQKSKVADKKQPEIFDAPYTGMQSNAGGVVGMIEVIQSDFERLETSTEVRKDVAGAFCGARLGPLLVGRPPRVGFPPFMGGVGAQGR